MSTSNFGTENFQEFKKELLQEIQELLNEQQQPRLTNYLKSSDVMKILKISQGTLQSLRDNGILPFVKVGGNIFYDSMEIQKMMNKHKVVHPFSNHRKDL